jgi:hypothetical protein
VTFGQALTLLESLHSRRDLVVIGVFGGPGLAIAGEVLPRLPSSIRSLWGAAASSSAIPLQLAIASQQETTLDIPVLGAARIDLVVERDGPLGPSAPGQNQGAPKEAPPGGAAASSNQGATVKEESL